MRRCAKPHRLPGKRALFKAWITLEEWKGRIEMKQTDSVLKAEEINQFKNTMYTRHGPKSLRENFTMKLHALSNVEIKLYGFARSSGCVLLPRLI